MDEVTTQPTNTEAAAAPTAEVATDQTQTAGSDQSTAQEVSQSDQGGEDKSVAPEQYEAFTIPDDMPVSEAETAEFGDLAKGLGLSQEQAQQLIDYQAKRAAAQNGVYADMVNGWVESVHADTEIGGAKLEQNLGAAHAAVQKFGGDDLAALLDYPSPENPTGMALGNNPAFIRFALRVAKATGEDKAGATNKASASISETANVFYGT
jgi:hypothetical protein